MKLFLLSPLPRQSCRYLLAFQSPGVLLTQYLFEQRELLLLVHLSPEGGEKDLDHRLAVRDVAQIHHHEVSVLHEDGDEYLDLFACLHSQDKLCVKPLLTGDVVNHLALVVETDGLPGEPLLTGVGVSQLEHEVEQVGVSVPEGVPLEEGVDHVLDRGVDVDIECEVLNVSDNAAHIEPKSQRLVPSDI